MTVEMRIERHENIPVGTALRGVARLLSAAEKSFMTEYLITATDGRPMAAIRQSLLAVNLQSRRSVPVPKFVHAALERA